MIRAPEIDQDSSKDRGDDAADAVEADRAEVGSLPFRLRNPIDEHIHHGKEQNFPDCKKYNAEHKQRQSVCGTKDKH
ncbi:hypothetical protein D3C73_1595990 [compost metagenome]